MIANEVVPDDLGGDCLFVNISAKTGDGIENLLETIALQSEILDLKIQTGALKIPFIGCLSKNYFSKKSSILR